MFRVDCDDVRVGDLFKDNRYDDTVYRTVTQVCASQNIVMDEYEESHSTFRTFFRCNDTISRDEKNIVNTTVHKHEAYDAGISMSHTIRQNNTPFTGVILDINSASHKYTRMEGTCSIVLDQRTSVMHVRFSNHTHNCLRALEGVWLARRSIEEDIACERWTSEHNTPRQYVSIHAVQKDSRFTVSMHFSTPNEYGALIAE